MNVCSRLILAVTAVLAFMNVSADVLGTRYLVGGKWNVNYYQTEFIVDASGVSDGLTPNPSYDYVIEQGRPSGDKHYCCSLPEDEAKSESDYTFNGHSLTAGSADGSKGSFFNIYGPKLVFGNEGLIANACTMSIYYSEPDRPFCECKLGGKIQINGALGKYFLQSKYADQHLDIDAELSSAANSGISMQCTGGAAYKPIKDSFVTNTIIRVLGDVSKFYGTFKIAGSGDGQWPVVFAMGSVPCPGKVQVYGTTNAFLRTATASNDIQIASLELRARSHLYPEITLGSPTCGTVRVATELTVNKPVRVLPEVLDSGEWTFSPAHDYPLLTAPENVELDPDDFVLVGIKNATAEESAAFALAVSPDANGRSTLYLKKKRMASPDQPITAASWSGASLESDSVLDKDNWQGLKVPNLETGTTLATFAEANGIAEFPSGLSTLNGIRFAGGAFGLTGTDLSSSVAMFRQGVAVDDAGTYSIEPTVMPFGDQTWVVPEGATLTIAGGFADYDEDVSSAITVTGTGTIVADGNGDAFTSPVVLGKGLSGRFGGHNPLGVGGVTFTSSSDATRIMRFGDFYTSAPVTFDMKERASNMQFCAVTNGTVEFAGEVSYTQVVRHYVEKDAELVFSGGFDAKVSLFYSGEGDLVISNRPFRSSGAFNLDAARCLVYCGGNTNTHENGLNLSGGEMNSLICKTAYIADRATSVNMVGGGWKSAKAYRTRVHILDIGGYDQEFGVISMGGNSAAIITNSGAAATLHVFQTKDRLGDGEYASLSGSIAGPIDFWKSGACDLCVSNRMTATGTLKVDEGVLRFADDASWRNATNVTVSGETASVVISHPDVFEKTVAFDVSDGGSIEIPEGVRIRAQSLTVDGDPLPAGTWAHGATYDETHFRTPAISGAGCMKVGKCGLVLIFR